MDEDEALDPRMVASYDQLDAVVGQMVERMRGALEYLTPAEAAVEVAAQLGSKYGPSAVRPALADLLATALVRLAARKP
jgi:hypothetical protein